MIENKDLRMVLIRVGLTNSMAPSAGLKSDIAWSAGEHIKGDDSSVVRPSSCPGVSQKHKRTASL